ncbi:MAG: cupin domain-containing protein [Peptococcaceae bacterium]|nr:cupin domain-containing protein [Peptococcaceae bacterium]
MKDKAVLNESDIPFFSVDWGRTKVLVGKGSPAASDRVMVKITEYLPGYIHEKHVHPVQEEIIFVLSGRGLTETAGGKRDIKPGDVVFIPAGLEHATYNPYKETLRAVIIKSPPDND